MVLKYINSLNDNKYFVGIVILTLNLFSRFVPIKLTKNQKRLLEHTLFKQIIIFSISFSVTRDIILSIVITAAFYLLTTHLLNEHSDMCVLPEHLKKLHTVIDDNGNNIISEEELQNALRILEKAKKYGTNLEPFNL